MDAKHILKINTPHPSKVSSVGNNNGDNTNFDEHKLAFQGPMCCLGCVASVCVSSPYHDAMHTVPSLREKKPH